MGATRDSYLKITLISIDDSLLFLMLKDRTTKALSALELHEIARIARSVRKH